MAFIDASRNDTDLTPNATAFTAYDDSNYQNGMSKFFESLKSVGLRIFCIWQAWRRSFPAGEAGIQR